MFPGQVVGPNWVVALPCLSLSSFLTAADSTSPHRVDELHWDHLLLLIECSGHQPTPPPAVSHPTSSPHTTREAKAASDAALAAAALMDQVEPPPREPDHIPDHQQQSLHQPAGLTRGSGPVLRSAIHAPGPVLLPDVPFFPPLVSAPAASCPHLLQHLCSHSPLLSRFLPSPSASLGAGGYEMSCVPRRL